MSTDVLLAVMGGIGMGVGITALAYEMKHRRRSQRLAKQRSLLEDDLYPYYPTPKRPTKEVKHDQVRDI